MNWYDKIQSLTTFDDNSPELKRGEIKGILLRQAKDIVPDFEFLTYKNGCYTFQRIRNFKSLNVYETFHINFGLKDRNFCYSVASRLNLELIYSNSYNTGLINPHIDLISLKKGGSVPIEESYYFHNGHIKTTTEVVEQIFDDYNQFGIPFIDNQFKFLKESNLMQVGLDYIANLSIDKETLRAQIEKDLADGGYLISNIKLPICVDLKDNLMDIGGQNKQNRQRISNLSIGLLQLYCSLNPEGVS